MRFKNPQKRAASSGAAPPLADEFLQIRSTATWRCSRR
jgi:hypothetical protein